MAYDTLGFALFNKCTAKCKHCCFSCSPESQQRIDINRVIQYIKESEEISEIKTIAFTGGEVFLEYPTLLKLVEISTEVGKNTSIATNGFWAVSEEATYDKLYQLKKSGLKHLSISHDRYHSEFISTNNIKNILKVSLNLDIQVSIAIVKLKDEKIGDLIDKISSDIYPASIKIGACMPVGSAQINFNSSKFDRTMDIKDARCTYGGSLSILFDGRIYPCCSQVIMDTGLYIGDFNKISLEEALYKAKNNALLYFLRNEKMEFFTNYSENVLDEIYPKKIVNPCELCKLLFESNKVERFHDYIMKEAKSKIK